MDLTGREIVLGVTGGIAAYKSAEVVSRLRHLGANVHVIMTKNATEFVSPLTFQTLSANQVVTDTFQAPEYWNVEHVALAKLAEVFVIAPATANIIAKMAAGIADDMLSTTVLATKAPVLIAPAMNTGMWTADATRENVQKLKTRGVHFVGPDSGILACGDEGAGRMSEPEAIVEAIRDILDVRRDLEGLKILVTAGATKERLDPVRYMTNDSSGKMGFAIAEAARNRGAEVTAVYGSVTAPVPEGIRRIQIESAQELASYIRIGSLSLELEEIRSNVVGAQLGQRALSTSLIGGLIGLAIVILIMIFAYKIPGIIAGFALVMYEALDLVALNAFDMTLTLPGIAGVILSIGMAVDASQEGSDRHYRRQRHHADCVLRPESDGYRFR